ncbi:hypothetical protein E4T50_02741 [Aureobasidium sp. EXF-12298]|nr:hypothetical protein E4T50_02741 [Aureobasidium sp. EXF-12298]
MSSQDEEPSQEEDSVQEFYAEGRYSEDEPFEPEPKDLLALSISDLYKNGAYSDFKIICGPDTYYVHKAIICPHSEFFRAACRPDAFQEGKTGIVTLPCNPGRDMEAIKAPIQPNEFEWDLDVEDFTAVKFMIHYFYHHDYPCDIPTHRDHKTWTPGNVAKGVLAIHSKMYAMGDKYQVPGLKALAVRKFKLSYEKTCAGFDTAAVIAFMSTPETEQGMRQVIVDTLGRYPWIAKNEVVNMTVKKIPELLYAFYRRLVKNV